MPLVLDLAWTGILKIRIDWAQQTSGKYDSHVMSPLRYQV